MRILLIDDEKELVTTISERLELRNIDNDWAVSGEEGLALLRRKRYDWVVVDLKMPGIGGFEAIKAIKKEQPETRIVLLTGHSAPEDLDRAMDLGADSYLIKPVDIEKLLAVMEPTGRKEKRT
jgi:DNA-binding response OmpR family regulator